jgi:hypothetical protein
MMDKVHKPSNSKLLEVQKEFYLLGYNTMKSAERQSTFQRNISSPFSGLKNKLSKKLARKHVASMR